MTRVLVALGSNVGASEATVCAALDELRALARGGFRASSLWRTSPVDCRPGTGDFVNAAAAFETRLPTPQALLAACKALERRHGRAAPAERHAPRELDVDLILFGGCVLQSGRLILPHPRALMRRFVMVPAAEVAADWVWPGSGGTIGELAAALVTTERLTRLPAVAEVAP